MKKKYNLIFTNHKIKGLKLYRIKALIDMPSRGIKVGDLGGCITSHLNLAQTGLSWINKNAIVIENAQVKDNALIDGFAKISGNASVENNATVGDRAHVTDDVHIRGNSFVTGKSNISQNAIIEDDATIDGNVRICGHAIISDKAKVYDFSCVVDYAKISEQASVCGNATICGYAQVISNSKIQDSSFVGGSAIISGALLKDNAVVDCKNEMYIFSNLLLSHDVFITSPADFYISYIDTGEPIAHRLYGYKSNTDLIITVENQFGLKQQKLNDFLSKGYTFYGRYYDFYLPALKKICSRLGFFISVDKKEEIIQ